MQDNAGRSIPSPLRFVYRVIFLFIHATIIISRISFFVAAGTSRRSPTSKGNGRCRLRRDPPPPETRAQESGHGIKTNFAGAKSTSSPHNACCPCIIYTRICARYRRRCTISRVSCTLSCTHARGVIFPESARQREPTGRLKIFARTFARGSAAISLRLRRASAKSGVSLRNCLRFYLSIYFSFSFSLSFYLSLSLLYPLHYFASAICNVPNFNATAVSPEFCSLSDNIHV